MWHVYMCDICICVTCVYVWHVSCISVTWLIPLCGVACLRVLYASSLRMTLKGKRDLCDTCYMSHSYVWYTTLLQIRNTLPVYKSHSHLWCTTLTRHVWFICVIHISMANTQHCTSLVGAVAWLIYTCDMTHFSVWRDVCVLVTWCMLEIDTQQELWLVCMCVCVHVCMCETWLIRICDTQNCT